MTREEIMQLNTDYLNGCESEHKMNELFNYVLEQQPCEEEYIKVPKKALKYRTAGMVAYNAEWLKNNFDIERAVICGAQQPSDTVSRGVFEQVMGERDVAIGQLKELGYELGHKKVEDDKE